MKLPLNEDDPKLRFVPLDKAVALKNGIVMCHLNDWWAIHPTKGVVFYKTSPQCNSNKAVTQTIKKMYPWAEVRQLPVVMYHIDPQDYC